MQATNQFHTRRGQRGNTFIGVLIGLLLGIAAAVIVAVLVGKVPVKIFDSDKSAAVGSDGQLAPKTSGASVTGSIANVLKEGAAKDPNAAMYVKPKTAPMPVPAPGADGVAMDDDLVEYDQGDPGQDLTDPPPEEPVAPIKSTVYIPQAQRGVPQAQQGVPQAQRGVPQAQQGVPQAQQGVPQAQQGVPQAQQGVPQAQQGTPQAQQGIPQAQQGVPQAQQGVPQAQQGVPQAQQGATATEQKKKLPSGPTADANPRATDLTAANKAADAKKLAEASAKGAKDAKDKTKDAGKDHQAKGSDPLGDMLKTKEERIAAAKVPKKTAPASTAERKTSSDSGRDNFTYYVQAGAYQTRSAANAGRAKVLLSGLDAKVSEREQQGDTIFRVRAGPFQTCADAEKARERVSAAGMSSELVAVPK